ncbi:MAG TPA: metallophosphoesterase family protein, partial [Bacteroidales bacterium]|nr:metallophosphoesterase family protein [Bacteroidales bacterium]
MKKVTLIVLSIGLIFSAFGQSEKNAIIPKVLSNIKHDSNDNLFYVSPKTGAKSFFVENTPYYSVDSILINPTGTKTGISFDFKKKDFWGIIYYGMYAQKGSKYPQPVFFKKKAKIIEGKADINLKALAGKYDIANYETTGQLKIGYRIVNNKGTIIYDGKINVNGKGPFDVDLSITEGPFVNNVTENEAVIWFNTNKPCSPSVTVNGKVFKAPSKMMNMMGDIHHEIRIHHLKPDTKYYYTVQYGDNGETYSFKTNPNKGSRKPFVFAFTSDSRQGNGGGERNIYGANAYIMKKMAALALSKNAAFFQFTGDMINGYSSSVGEARLECKNWKRSIESFWHYIPFYVAPGNHEVMVTTFDDGSKYGLSVDKFPYNNNSGERIFADEFVNFENGPASEDGSKYDPDNKNTDFPPYRETAYYYIYGNMAMVVLHSNYLYTPSTYNIPEIGGNVHGYIMDNQLNWLDKILAKLSGDSDIDNIFVTIHTPAFPNGGHSGDDMWYNGNNNIRPYIAGKPVKKGIIERRDQFLNI